MRAIVTGQIGVDKKPYLQAVVDQAERRNGRVELFNVGNMMYREAPDVRPGRILDLPWSRLARRWRTGKFWWHFRRLAAIRCPTTVRRLTFGRRWRRKVRG